MKKWMFLFLIILCIPSVSASQLFYSDAYQTVMNVSGNGATADLSANIIMEEIPYEFLSNVSSITGFSFRVCSGNASNAPEGDLTMRVYKNVGGIWYPQYTTSFTGAYHDCGSIITTGGGFPDITIEAGYDYGVGFYTDITDFSNDTWWLYGGGLTHDVPSGYNVWKTNNPNICTYNTLHVCDPNNLFGYNSQFTTDVNYQKVHTVFPSVDITNANGFVDEMGSIYMVVYGETTTPTPPSPTPTSPPLSDDTGYGNLTGNETSQRPAPYQNDGNLTRLNNSVIPDSASCGFISNMGYECTYGGTKQMIQDFALPYVLFGMIFYLVMLYTKPRG
jgi:hypothetical protein